MWQAQLDLARQETAVVHAEAIDAFAQSWDEEDLVWAHPPPSMLQQLVQLLRQQPLAAAVVCTPHWPGSTWYRELMELSSEMASFPPGAFRRVAFDAPPLLSTWGATLFLVPRR